MTRVAELIEGVLQFPADGRDAEETLGMYADIQAQATVEDLPLLLKTLESDRSDFWVREMLAEPDRRPWRANCPTGTAAGI